MTYDLIQSILDSTELPYTYLAFDDPSEIEGEDKYIAYFEAEKIRFLADDQVYHFEPQFAVELYTRHKDPDTEQKLIDLFGENGVVWSGGVSTYIDSEKMYQTVYYC